MSKASFSGPFLEYNGPASSELIIKYSGWRSLKKNPKQTAGFIRQAEPERNPIRNCFGFISSSFARRVNLWTTAARGNLGDYSCQATPGLNQCAYAVKMHHGSHASVLVLRSKQEFRPPRLKNRSHTFRTRSVGGREAADGAHHAVVAVSSAPPLAAAQRFINTVSTGWSTALSVRLTITAEVCSPRSVVHAAVIAAVWKPVASANDKQTHFKKVLKKMSIDQRRGWALSYSMMGTEFSLAYPPLGGGGGGRGRFRARLLPRPPLLSGGGGPLRGLMSS